MLFVKMLTDRIPNTTKDKRYLMVEVNCQLGFYDDNGVLFPTRFLEVDDWTILDDRKDRY